MDLAGYIPRNITQATWEVRVNKALSEAKRISIEQEETVLGVIASAINASVFGRTRTTDEKFIDSRIIVCGQNSDQMIAMKMPTIIEMVKFENERIGRKEMGEHLRKLGFRNNPPQKINRHQVRAWFYIVRRMATKIHDRVSGSALRNMKKTTRTTMNSHK